MRKIVLPAFLALLCSAPAFAAPTYGAAGCGVGSLIFGNKPGLVQVLAATTNGILGNQTFGISTGTLGCETAPGLAGATIFIEGNREALAKDISRGSGETLTNLSTLAGCKDPSAVGASLQKQFAVIFPSATTPTQQVSSSILSTLKSEPKLACSKLG